MMISMVIMSCGPSKEKQIEKIAAMEKAMFSKDAYSFSKERADSLVNMYLEYIEKNPADTLSPGYLFKAANIVMNGGDASKALGYFDRYMKDYPDGKKVAMCMFFKAFIYENMLRDLDQAREIYLRFIEKYPKDDFADDAQIALANLGKTPEMMIREFEERQKADSARRADSIAKTLKKGRKSK
jgi:outer membrane protein assembly factor BamD (BamD/ComL family)